MYIYATYAHCSGELLPSLQENDDVVVYYDLDDCLIVKYYNIRFLLVSALMKLNWMQQSFCIQFIFGFYTYILKYTNLLEFLAAVSLKEVS